MPDTAYGWLVALEAELAPLGIDVMVAKLFAFSLASAIAALGGTTAVDPISRVNELTGDVGALREHDEPEGVAHFAQHADAAPLGTMP